jgi:hypothetical protein
MLLQHFQVLLSFLFFSLPLFLKKLFEFILIFFKLFLILCRLVCSLSLCFFPDALATCWRFTLLFDLLNIVSFWKIVLETFDVPGVVLDCLKKRVRVALFFSLCTNLALVVLVNQRICKKLICVRSLLGIELQ